MSVMWHRILVPIGFCNKVIQASDATLDMEVTNIESLLAQLVALRDSWKAIWNEAKLVASSLQIEVKNFRHRSTTVLPLLEKEQDSMMRIHLMKI